MNASIAELLAALEDDAKRWEEAAVKIASLFPMPGPKSETDNWSKERQKYLVNAEALRKLKAKFEQAIVQSKVIVT
jgi:hypothetical protein